jgi:hypothetical protein
LLLIKSIPDCFTAVPKGDPLRKRRPTDVAQFLGSAANI